MALIDSYTLSQDAPFQHKVQMACVKAANSVISANGAQTDIARKILDNPTAYAVTVAQMIAISDATVAASAPTGSSLTDNQIQSAVNTFLPNLVR
jgi:predicted transcriptional regulator